MGKHKQYDPALKTKVVLEVLKGDKSLAQICREHEVSADLVCHWRDVFLERTPRSLLIRAPVAKPLRSKNALPN